MYKQPCQLCGKVSEESERFKETIEFLKGIRDMPERDQDDVHRMRNLAKIALEKINGE